jgi:hypothetical protein
MPARRRGGQRHVLEGAQRELAARQRAALVALEAQKLGYVLGRRDRIVVERADEWQPRGAHAHQIELRLGDPAFQFVAARIAIAADADDAVKVAAVYFLVSPVDVPLRDVQTPVDMHAWK